jgi:alpha-tubulin suppressor-like RCC1 family protein
MKMVKKQMMTVVALTLMLAVLTVSSLAIVACQSEEPAMTEDATTTQEEGTTNQEDATNTSSTVGPETLSTLTAWGDNFFGQLGNGITLPYGNHSNTPVEVSDLEGAEAKALAGGQNHSLALKDDGTVLAWGLNQDGQLGDGTTTDSSTPVQVEDPNDPSGYLTGVAAIAAGSSHSLALKSDGKVWAWGSNQYYGPLGNGTNADSTTPVQVSGLDGIEAISAGLGYSLALKSDGTVWAWGTNTSSSSQGTRIGGQLGDNEIASSNTPVQVRDLTGEIEAIAAGASHGLALKDDGTVWAWGENFFGQLGHETTTDSSIPVQVSNLDGVTTIAAGGAYSLALKNDGTVWAWGSNRFGQLGDGTTNGTPTTCENTEVGGRVSSSCTDSSTPVQMSEVGGIKAIGAGGAHGLALEDDGSVWAWGFNQSGQLGNGTETLGASTVGTNTPARVRDLPGGVEAIAAGGDHSLAGW